MKRKTIVLAVLVVALVWISGPDRAEGSDPVDPAAPEIAPATIKQPQRLEAVGVEFPSRLPADEAERLFLRMGLSPDRHSATFARPSETAAPAAGAAPSGGVSRTIELNVPEVVNRTDRFVFRDVTGRQADAPRHKMSIEDRRKAVEAYRLSLVKPKK